MLQSWKTSCRLSQMECGVIHGNGGNLVPLPGTRSLEEELRLRYEAKNGHEGDESWYFPYEDQVSPDKSVG